jgi:hypothetical protein
VLVSERDSGGAGGLAGPFYILVNVGPMKY